MAECLRRRFDKSLGSHSKVAGADCGFEFHPKSVFISADMAGTKPLISLGRTS